MNMNAAPCHFGMLEVHQKGKRQPGCFQVVEALRRVFIRETIRTFELDHQNVLDKDVGKNILRRTALCT